MEVPRTTPGGPTFDDPCASLSSSHLVRQLAPHQQHRDDFAYQRRVAMLAEAQRSIISTRYNEELSGAFLSRVRSANNAPSQVRFAVGDQVMYWRGNNQRKSQVDALVGSRDCHWARRSCKRVDQSSQRCCLGSWKSRSTCGSGRTTCVAGSLRLPS